MYGWVLDQKCDLWSFVITVSDQFFVSSGERREGEGSRLRAVKERGREKEREKDGGRESAREKRVRKGSWGWEYMRRSRGDKREGERTELRGRGRERRYRQIASANK